MAAALLAGGCAHGNAARSDDVAVEPQVMVRVENNNWSDMNVYVLRSGTRQRLGSVSSMTTAKFKLPRHVLVSTEPVRLLADPVGSSRGILSPPLLLNAGQVVEWRVENNPALSSAFIR
jgi:hypothetical protein